MPVSWLLMLAACHPLSIQEQTIDLTGPPLLEIGVVEGEEPYQLYGAVSSTRREDGSIVLLNAGTQQLRYFDGAGRFLAGAGGRGDGPGEFRAPVRLYPKADGSLVVFDRVAERMSEFDAEGVFVGSSPFDLTGEQPFPLDTWLHGRYWIEGPADPAGRESAMLALDRLPALPPGELFRYVYVDRWGRLWVRRPVALDSGVRYWRVYDHDGETLVTVQTDPTHEIHEVGLDYVLGRARLELGIEVVRVYRLDMSPGDRPPYFTAPSLAQSRVAAQSIGEDLPPETMGRVRASLRTLMGSQESYYANNSSYAGPDDDVVFDPPEGIKLRIVQGDPWGWSGALIDVESEVMCGVGIGLYVPPGWREGRVLCSR